MKQPDKQRLSSRQTMLLKFVAPGFLILSLGLMIYLNSTTNFAPVAMMSMYIAISIFILIYAFYFGSLKKVFIDDSFLYVSSFNESVKIPLSHIDRVSEMKIFNPRRITIHLKNSSQYGKKVVFLGYHQQWLLFGDHPVIAIIKSKIKNLKN
ncbi:MAG: hypothetical protein AAF466_14080 [Bacteroidota bacterium]